MEQDQQPYQSLWASAPSPAGSPAAPSAAPPAPARRRLPRSAVAVGATAFFALGGAGAAFAFTGHDSTSTPVGAASASSGSTSGSTAGPSRLHPGHGPGGPLAARLGGRVVHGQFTVRDGSGYKTIDVQVGAVKAVSPSSITVQSSDGHTQTYTVSPATVVDSQAGGISTVKVTDEVAVTAVDGTVPAASNIVDRTKIRSSREGFGLGGGGAAPVPPAGGGPAAPGSA